MTASPSTTHNQQPANEDTGPMFVGGVFLLLALTTLGLGLYTAYRVHQDLLTNALVSGSSRAFITLSVVAGTIVIASLFAFFGYVLILLCGIRRNTETGSRSQSSTTSRHTE
jgi:hypothetical protein